ncbi:MAG: trimethylamine methyltransferase family protein [Desulfobacterales bacterium]|nr:trimethylamine methyltransferase family protein [Desulfobacterales bacterium]
MRTTPAAGINVVKGWGLKSFSEDELQQIHAATLDVMQTTGLLVANDEALDILDKGGCWVNKKTQVVRFPNHIVEEAIRLCPGNVLLAGRNPEQDFLAGGKNIGFTTFGTAVLTQDLDTGEIKDSTLDDLGKMALMCDALEHVDILTPPVSATDMPLTSYELHGCVSCFANTTKHICTDAESGPRVGKIIDMAALIVGGSENLKHRPIVSFGGCPTSPLQLVGELCELTIASAKAWLPNVILSMAMSGASSPMPLAGTMVIHNAEVLGCTVLAQCTNPGTPIIYGSSTTTFYMKHGTATVGAPEMAMISAAAAEMSNFYGIPSYVGGT